MDRFSNVSQYFRNINRNVLLVIGLIIIGGLIAAAFVLGDTDEIANGDNDEVTVEEGTEVNGEVETEANGEDNAVATEEENGNDVDVHIEAGPSELADTGPMLPVAGAVLLGATGYLYGRSRKNVAKAHNKE